MRMFTGAALALTTAVAALSFTGTAEARDGRHGGGWHGGSHHHGGGWRGGRGFGIGFYPGFYGDSGYYDDDYYDRPRYRYYRYSSHRHHRHHRRWR